MKTLFPIFPTLVTSEYIDCGPEFCDNVRKNIDASFAYRRKQQHFADEVRIRQTKPDLHHLPFFASFISKIEHSVSEYLSVLGCPPNVIPRIQALWATISASGDDQSLHLHPNSFISGVYYVKASENCGNLIFRDPRVSTRMVDLNCQKESVYSNRTFSIVPENGMLILFPGWLEHLVTKNSSDDVRISLSFNSTLSGLIGCDQRFSTTML